MSDAKLIKEMKDKYPQLSEIAEFGFYLLQEIKKIQPNLDLSSIKLSPELITLKAREGFPLMERSKVQIPPAEFQKVFTRMVHVISEKREGLRHAFSEILNKLEKGSIDLNAMAGSRLKQGAEKDDSAESLLGLVTSLSLKPFGIAYGDALRQYLDDNQRTQWLQPYCPVCGASPLLAFLKGEEGTRYLFCSWCDTTWVFPRIQCPFCQNSDQGSLKYFTMEEEKEKREQDKVSVCQKCNRYIKTIDMRKFAEDEAVGADLHMADLASLQLDFLAEREGYQRITRGLLSF